MTTVAFHFNVADVVNYTCRLARKAVATGAKLVILGEGDLLQPIDAHLWHLSSTAFVPHCDAHACANVIARSTVLLTDTLTCAPHHHVLVNLTADVPTGFDAFERVIEVVSLDDAWRQAARKRWRFYERAGFKLVRHDVQREVVA